MRKGDLAQELGKFATPTLLEASAAVAALCPSIAPLYRPIGLCGPAYTVLASPGDNLAVHLALAEAPAGSVLVVATGPETQKGAWGEIMTRAALARGIRGLVTDGAVRDTRAIRRLGFPVFCAGIAIPGTTKCDRGVRNEPVMLGGLTVRPADFMVGDDDGVVVVAADRVDEALEKAGARARKEAGLIKRLRRGELTLDLLNLRGSGAKPNG